MSMQWGLLLGPLTKGRWEGNLNRKPTPFAEHLLSWCSETAAGHIMPEIFCLTARSGAAAEEFISLPETLDIGPNSDTPMEETLKAVTNYESDIIIRYVLT